MHIRRTDKTTEDDRIGERDFETFSRAFKSWAYWQARPSSRPSVILGSEVCLVSHRPHFCPYVITPCFLYMSIGILLL